MSIELHWSDCFDVFPSIKDQSIDLVLCDPPYGTTSCKWDSVLPLDLMWKELERIVKPKAAILIFSLQPFTSKLICSNLILFKYSFVWSKSRALGFQNAKLRPMTRHEDISVFSKGNSANRASNLMQYYPQGLIQVNKQVKGIKGGKTDQVGHKMLRPNHKQTYTQQYTNYPDTILNFNNEGKTVHPTQKPVELLEYLIKTYSLEDQTVLDFTMGSGSTGVACKNTNRSFIGIEKEKEYFDIAKQRILTEGIQEPEIDICSMFN